MVRSGGFARASAEEAERRTNSRSSAMVRQDRCKDLSIGSEDRLTVSLKTLAEMLDAHRGSVRRWLGVAGIQPIALSPHRNGAIRYHWKEIEFWLATLERVD
jgi:hypothetical protein